MNTATYDRLIDGAFRRWVATLTPTLRPVAFELPRRVGHARGRWHGWQQVFPTTATRALPWLVAEGFPRVTQAARASLCVAYVFGVLVALVDDRLIDGQVAFSRELNLVRRSLEAESQRRLAVIGKHDGFWRRYRKAFRAYAAAHAREPQLWGGDGAGDGHRCYARESAAKTAIARLPMLAIGALGGARAPGLARLSRLVDHYLVGMQYADDASDWEDDFRGGRWTYFIQRHLSEAEARRTAPITEAELRRRVAAGTVTEEFLCRASFHYAACIRCSRWFEMPTLRAWVAQRRDEMRESAVARQRARLQPQQDFAYTLAHQWLPRPGRNGHGRTSINSPSG